MPGGTSSVLIASAKAVIALGSLSVAAQIAPLTGTPVVGGTATQWTLDVALVFAVGVLAKAVVALFKTNAQDRADAAALARVKDDQILAMAGELQKTLAQNNEVLKTANARAESNFAAIQELKQQQQQLIREEQHAQAKRRP